MESTPLKRGKQNTKNITKIYINTIYIQYSKKRERSGGGGRIKKTKRRERREPSEAKEQQQEQQEQEQEQVQQKTFRILTNQPAKMFFLFVFVIPRDESDERRSSKRVCIWSIVGRPLCLPYPQWDPGPVDSV